MRKVVVIVGPTCTGKTSLAESIQNSQIISADSRQIVKGLDFGTGKKKSPTDKTSHILGYDLINPDQDFSAYDFAKYFSKKLDDISDEVAVLLVGGTGFYIDAATGLLKIDASSKDETLRAELNSYSLPELQEKLKALDKDLFLQIDSKNKVRLVRAIEKLTVKPLNFEALPQPNAEFLFVGLTASREELYKRADGWLDLVWPEVVKETSQMLQAGYADAKYINGLIYKSVKSFLNGQLTSSQALERAKFDTHAYIRRQQTWFKRNKLIRWFDVNSPLDAKKYIEEWLG